MSTNTVDPAQPTPSTVVVATDGSVTVTQVSNATTVTYPGVFSTPFSPLDLSPTLWLDASDETTITESGGAVSQWDDKSGNGYDVTQGTGSYQPTTGTRTLNSLNVLDFTPQNYLNVAFGAAVAQPYTVFVVFQFDGSGTASHIFDGSSASSRGFGIRNIDKYSLYAGSFVQGGTTDNDPHVSRWTFNTTSSSIHVDGASIASGDAGSYTTGGFKVGANLTDTNGLDGFVGEMIFVEGTLTAQQISDTETYLADKWGITL